MKIIKMLVLVLLLFFAVSANSQIVTSEAHYNTAYEYDLTFTLDSNATSTTSLYFDISRLNIAGSIYCTYSYVQSHWGYASGQDTSWIILKGKDNLGNTKNFDTVSAACVSYLLQTTAGNVNQVTLSPSTYFPNMAIYVAPKVSGGNTKNGKAGVLKISFWGYAVPVYSEYTKIPWK